MEVVFPKEKIVALGDKLVGYITSLEEDGWSLTRPEEIEGEQFKKLQQAVVAGSKNVQRFYLGKLRLTMKNDKILVQTKHFTKYISKQYWSMLVDWLEECPLSEEIKAEEAKKPAPPNSALQQAVDIQTLLGGLFGKKGGGVSLNTPLSVSKPVEKKEQVTE